MKTKKCKAEIENALFCMRENAELTVCEDCSKYARCDHTLQKLYAEMAAEALEKQIPKNVVKNATCSQACPCCGHPVKWNFCENCGQALKY